MNKKSRGSMASEYPTSNVNHKPYWLGPLIAVAAFCAGAAIPIFMAVSSMRAEALHQASLPLEQQNGCGMGALGAMMAMLILAPTFGCVTAWMAWMIIRLANRCDDGTSL